MTCATVLPLLSRRRDGRLADPGALDAHLAGCPACRALDAWLAALSVLSAKALAATAPESTLEAAREYVSGELVRQLLPDS
jgi:predicted anti-sigma-YlaC factor YlaD